ncbi:YqhR family membrane protein [Paenibacillus sp. P96]|uniref:YqhR family membrane protein n=1 Tax=Paenibacillus zeirhizosphaerae TaxID=2987519 RepID=A0ABT9FPU6_9BACL|nr:YqhR family membrane protein [Paenibacillus sp. P96]MDP4096758.1 YqhR family membrane protein [Paenibacillus sp. P96]
MSSITNGKRSPRLNGQQLTSPLRFSLELGFFAGLIWGLVRWLFYILHFTVVLPGFIAEPFFKHSFMKSTAGHWTGLLVFILFSMAATFLYTAVLRKLKGPYPGMIYGAVWWAVLFLWAGPLLGMLPPVTKLTWDSLVSEFCVFLLWGLFIGYTVAFEFTDDRVREHA